MSFLALLERRYASLSACSTFFHHLILFSKLIVLLHGATATRRSFGLQAPQMLWHYRVLLIDLPGHGSREKEPFTMEAG